MCAGVLELWARSDADPTVTDTVAALLGLLRTDEQALLVAEIEGEIVGPVSAGWDGWGGRLYRLAVHPAHRRVGVATRLVRDAERRLRDRGAVRIDAILGEEHDAARRFWTSAGYTHPRRRSRFIRDL